ncbi:hypothetical protein HZC09_00445 [Candidatus Micrarchaeota archaeon]|nr:hypothetical protein [Candidatus Micrarchaeota archaeon]
MFVFQLWEAFDFIATIVVFFFTFNRLFYPEVINNKAIALLVTFIVMFVLVIPFPIVKWLMFLGLFGYGFFWGFRPWEWGVTKVEEPYEGTFGQPYDASQSQL